MMLTMVTGTVLVALFRICVSIFATTLWGRKIKVRLKEVKKFIGARILI